MRFLIFQSKLSSVVLFIVLCILLFHFIYTIWLEAKYKISAGNVLPPRKSQLNELVSYSA